MVAEGELKSNVDDSDRVKDLQDEVAYLKAEVCWHNLTKLTAQLCAPILNNRTSKKW